jgi:hypothetical protein
MPRRRMAARGLLAAIIVGVAACGPDRAELADLVELCGEAGPVQVLPLDDHEAVGPDASVARVDDRWLYAVRTFEASVDSLHEVVWGPLDGPIAQIDARIESVDRCGGDWRVVAEGLDLILPRLHEGEPWLGYREDAYALYWFDPHGRFTPRRLATIPHWTWLVVDGHTIFVHRTDHRDIARITLDGADGDVRVDVLVTDVASTWSMRRGPSSIESIAVLRDDGALVALELATGATDLVREGVRVFATTEDLRWIAWVPGDPAQGSTPAPTEAWLLDRTTGDEQPIAFDDAGGIVVQIHGEHLVAWSVDDGQVLATRFIWLPGGLAIDLEGRWNPFGSMHAGAFGTLVPAPFGGVQVFAPVDGALVPISAPIQGTSVWDDAIWAFDRAVYEHLDRPDGQRPYDLVRYPYPTFEPEVVERRIYPGAAIGSDRWVSVVDATIETGFGTLQVIEGDSGETRVVDRRVDFYFERLEPHERDGLRPWRTDEIVYQVREPGSSRTGLWRARFSP